MTLGAGIDFKNVRNNELKKLIEYVITFFYISFIIKCKRIKLVECETYLLFTVKVNCDSYCETTEMQKCQNITLIVVWMDNRSAEAYV